MKATARYIKSLLKNVYIRMILGSVVVVVLTLAVGSQKYNGTGMNIVEQAVLKGQAEPWDFALKLVFTAISLAVGFRGGEIVPVFAVGASFGLRCRQSFRG